MPRLSRSDAARIRMTAAQREIGRRHATAIVFGPFFVKATGVVLGGVGLYWVWATVDRALLAKVAGIAGLVVLGLVAALTVSSGGRERRMLNNAVGRRPLRIGLVGAAVAVSLFAASAAAAYSGS